MNSKIQPTLVLMLKTPEPGFVKTRLAASLGPEASAKIYRALVEKQLRECPPGMPIEVHFAPPSAGDAMRAWLGDAARYVPQCEGSLGDRLVAASAAVFAAGASYLVFLGGDCPYIDSALLERCAVLLLERDVVIGPAVDGGYYLIGMNRHEPRLFEGIAWSTESVLEQTLARISSLGISHVLLPMLEDVDDLSSWERARGLLEGPPAT